MSNVTTTTPTTAATTGTTTAGTSGTSVNRADNGMGENDFLNLMMMQLKNQDPMNPSDPTQYLSELANFSTLEQETQIAQSSQTTASQQQTASALGLLGHAVTYTDSTGATQTGTVSKVDFTSAGPSLTIGANTGVTLGDITSVS
jgi:flagellar basal-body rod modification protein FlgD